MAERSYPIRDGTLATVAGGIILAGLGKLTGVLPQIWDFAARMARSLFHGAAQKYSLTLPLFVWLILWALALVWVVRRVRGRIHAHAEAEGRTDQALIRQPEPTQAETELTQLEQEIMALFARNEGREMVGPIIAEALKVNNLRAEDAVESLVARNFLDEQHNAAYGTRFYVARAGRDYILKKGLA
jgi:hypothetical protein